MPNSTPPLAKPDPPEPRWLLDLIRSSPQIPLMAPFMAYLLLLLLDEIFSDQWRTAAIALRGVLALGVVWAVRRHFPPLGRPCWILAISVGLFVAWGWVAGQHLFDAVGLGKTLSWSGLLSSHPHLLGDNAAPFDPHMRVGAGAAFWLHVIVKITVASTVVPIVEELFWRGLLLRMFVSWDHFEQVPMGRFNWIAFVGTSLLSVLEHPANWGVSIACWLVYNGLFYATRSLKCLMITHGITNLALYSYVVWAGGPEWRFW